MFLQGKPFKDTSETKIQPITIHKLGEKQNPSGFVGAEEWCNISFFFPLVIFSFIFYFL